MIFAKSLSLRQTGWLRQNGWLSSRLKPIAGLISETDVERAQNDWDAVCDVMQLHAHRRSRALASVEQVHRDPFEAIEPILNAKSPIQEYRKITKQIIAHLGRGGLEGPKGSVPFSCFNLVCILGCDRKTLGNCSSAGQIAPPLKQCLLKNAEAN